MFRKIKNTISYGVEYLLKKLVRQDHPQAQQQVGTPEQMQASNPLLGQQEHPKVSKIKRIPQPVQIMEDETEDVVLPVEVLQFQDLTNQLKNSMPSQIVSDIAQLMKLADEQNVQIEESCRRYDLNKARQPEKVINKEYDDTVLITYQRMNNLQRSFYFPIDQKDFTRLLQVFKDTELTRVVVSHPNLQEVVLNVKSFKTLKNGCWLNDEVVNGYIALINQKNQGQGSLILKSHTYNLMAGQEEQKITRICKKQNITSDVKFVLVPINPRNVHWSLILVDRVQKRLVSYDSLGGLDKQVAYEVNVMVKVWDKVAPVGEANSGDYTVEKGPSPRQNNSYDCGVFMLKNIQVISQSPSLTPLDYFGQELIFYDRLQIGVSLLRGKLG